MFLKGRAGHLLDAVRTQPPWSRSHFRTVALLSPWNVLNNNSLPRFYVELGMPEVLMDA